MGLDLDFDLLLDKMEFVAAGGISPVRTDPDLVQKAMPLLRILVLLPFLRILPILLSGLLMLGYKYDQLRIKLYLM